MFWHVSFWLLVVIILIPLPFKVYGYLTGKDKSSFSVKLEECINTTFMSFGLIAFYGFIHQQKFLNDSVWQIWLIIGGLWSVFAIFWSPKLSFAQDVIGRNKVKLLALLSSALYMPMFIAIYLYAF